MKKTIGLGLCLVLGFMLIVGCGGGTTTDTTTTTTAAGATTTTAEGATTTTTSSSVTTTTAAVEIGSVFDVSGAVAVASVARNSGAGAIKPSDIHAATVTPDDIVKITSTGAFSSIINPSYVSGVNISVIETGPDGSLYVGFSHPIYVPVESSSDEATTSTDEVETASTEYISAAFFRITTSGDVSVVDSEIYGVGTWYSNSNNGELPVKQVQFDSDGNLYYLGINSSWNTILKKKDTDGNITRIGGSNHEVRDFLVCPNGFILFHGSNVGDWSIEWLRVMYAGSVHNIFYNDGNWGWLRAYYKDVDNNVILVGTNLTLLDEELEKRYSGIIRVVLDETGAQERVEALYDDNNMYSDSYNTIGEQLNYGYWDPETNDWAKFFTTDENSSTTLPLSFEAGVSMEVIRTYIRNKYQRIDLDTLDGLGLGEMSTDESSGLTSWFNSIIAERISGETWQDWRTDNGLSGVSFANARQIVFADSGALYAVMNLDSWGGSTVKGDRLYQIVNPSGEAEIASFAQDATYKSMRKARAFGDYAIYLSSKVGMYKIFRLDLTDSSVDPTDLIPDKSNVEIASFNFNPVTDMLMYDVYDLNTNTSYFAEQLITSTTAASESTAEGVTIADIEPFAAE